MCNNGDSKESLVRLETVSVQNPRVTMVQDPLTKECPICFRQAPVSEYKRDRRTRDGLARRCGECQKRRDQLAGIRRRAKVANNFKRWMQRDENRLRQMIVSRMNKYAGIPLDERRFFRIYGPPDDRPYEERIKWLMDY